MSYAKLHTSLLTSSLWTEDTETRIVWITLLCLADRHGEVQASIPGLAKVAGVSLDACEKAIDKFLSPDKYSRSKVMDGQRLQEIDGGWEIITYTKHRAMASKEDQKERAAERQQRFRERNASVTPSNASVTPSNASVTPSNAPSRPVTENRDIAEAEAEAEAEEDKKEGADKPPRAPRFERPSIEAVLLQCAKAGLPEQEGHKFLNFYESKGWVVGKSPMKSWTHALANWKLKCDPNLLRTPAQRGPSLNEVQGYAAEKDDGTKSAILYAASWHQFWLAKQWKDKAGKLIDWKIEFSKSLSRHLEKRQSQ